MDFIPFRVVQTWRCGKDRKCEVLRSKTRFSLATTGRKSRLIWQWLRRVSLTIELILDPCGCSTNQKFDSTFLRRFVLPVSSLGWKLCLGVVGAQTISNCWNRSRLEQADTTLQASGIDLLSSFVMLFGFRSGLMRLIICRMVELVPTKTCCAGDPI